MAAVFSSLFFLVCETVFSFFIYLYTKRDSWMLWTADRDDGVFLPRHFDEKWPIAFLLIWFPWLENEVELSLPASTPVALLFRVVVCYSVCNKCVNKDGRSEPYLVCEIIHTWGLFFYDYFRKELLLLPAVYCVHQDNFGKSTELDVVRKHSTSSFSFLHSVLISR